MRLATYSLPLLTSLVTAMAASGCAQVVQPPAPGPAPVAQITAPPDPTPDEWNIFPDPMSGTVEVYHNGQSIGSITGDEKEDPPIPHPVRDQDPAP